MAFLQNFIFPKQTTYHFLFRLNSIQLPSITFPCQNLLVICSQAPKTLSKCYIFDNLLFVTNIYQNFNTYNLTSAQYCDTFVTATCLICKIRRKKLIDSVSYYSEIHSFVYSIRLIILNIPRVANVLATTLIRFATYTFFSHQFNVFTLS